jgi:serine/threonine protein kinase
MPAGTTGTLLAGRYRTIERVGSGGMATVLLAEDERLGRNVAVKRLHAESPEDTARRFRREARLGASLNHPNLVAVFDILSSDEGVLIVMEYVEGETLRDELERGPLPPARAIEVLRGIAAALDHAHAEGIVHRDVKPANVLLGSDGRVKLADLGIATAVEDTRITMSGTVLGTAAYMAPEQLEGEKPGPSVDVYALAVLAWESLSGRRAYEGRTPLEIAHRKASEAPPLLSEAWPDAPPAAVATLARAMGPELSGRPATATALVEELANALGLAPPRRRPVAPSAVRGAVAPEPPRRLTPPAPPVREPADLETAPRRRPPAPPAYARHARTRRSWLAPLLVVAAVVAVAAIALASAGGGSSKPARHTAAAAKKHHRASPAPASSASVQQTPAAATPPAGSSYQVPQPAGNDPAAGQRLNDQGQALNNAGRYSEAIPVLERAVRSFPPGTTDIYEAYALFNLGHALLKAGRPADAVPVLEERLKNPDQRATVQAELDAARAAAGGQH